MILFAPLSPPLPHFICFFNHMFILNKERKKNGKEEEETQMLLCHIRQ